MTESSYFPTNFLLSASSGFFGFVLSENFLPAVLLPLVFFFVGKAIDVWVRIYLENKKQK